MHYSTLFRVVVLKKGRVYYTPYQRKSDSVRICLCTCNVVTGILYHIQTLFLSLSFFHLLFVAAH